MSQNKQEKQASKNFVIAPPARRRRVEPDTSRNLATRRSHDNHDDEDKPSNEQESSSSSLSSSVQQGEQSSSEPSNSSPSEQAAPELSPSPQAQLIPMNPDPKPTTIQQSSFPPRQIFELIIGHIVNSIPASIRASRLDYLLLQLKEGQSLKDVMNKFDKKDLAVIAEHKKFIEILASNFTILLQKGEYAKFKTINHQQIILNVYASFSLDVSINQLRGALAKEQYFSKKQNAKLGDAFIEELMGKIRKDFETNNIMFVSEEDQIIQRRIEGKQIERLLNVDPFTDFGMEKDTQFDQISKYGIFCNKKEEGEMCKEGVFNYRLHRTMLAIQKFGIIVPQENIRLAKNLALFIIKLTDQHVANIVEASMKIAQVTSKSSSENTMDEVAYFSAQRQQGRFTVRLNMQSYENTSVSKLKYPSLMKIYRDLRTFELLEEEHLHDSLNLEMIDKFSHGKKRLNKDQKIVSEYFTKKPSTTDCIARLKLDTEKDSMKHKAALNKIAIQPRHINHYLQSHHLYRNHQISWRFNVIY